MRKFDIRVVVTSDTCNELISYLGQLTIVSGYSYISGEVGHRAAMKELEKRYGNPEIIANAFVKSAMDW